MPNDSVAAAFDAIGVLSSHCEAADKDATQRDVAIALRLNESAVTAMVTRLLKLSLLERIRSGTDSRAWCLHLTREGQVALQVSRDAFGGINARIESTFSQSEIKQLAEQLDRLTAAFRD